MDKTIERDVFNTFIEADICFFNVKIMYSCFGYSLISEEEREKLTPEEQEKQEREELKRYFYKKGLNFKWSEIPEEEREKLAKLTPEEREKQEYAVVKRHFNREDVGLRLMGAVKDAFDGPILFGRDPTLIREIDNNLSECKTTIDKERYIFSILRHFKGFSDVYHPKAIINRLESEIAKLERAKTMLEMPENELLENMAGKQTATPEEQSKEYDDLIEEKKKEIRKARYTSRRLAEYAYNKRPAGEFEECLGDMLGIVDIFALRLDALLLQYGVDLMRLQEESGIYLKEDRSIDELVLPLGGGRAIVQKLIDALPKYENDKQITDEHQPEQQPYLTRQAVNLTKELDTNRTQKYIPKAITAGIIIKTDTGYKKIGISKAQLAYFLELIYCRDNEGKDNGKDFPETSLNTIFGESRLGKARGQYINNKDGKPKGYEIIERIFE
jgi:hypothetical protein